MNNETKFLGYDCTDGAFVILEVVGVDGPKIMLETGQGTQTVEFNLFDMWKAQSRYRRMLRWERRESRRYTRQNNRETTRENP